MSPHSMRCCLVTFPAVVAIGCAPELRHSAVTDLSTYSTAPNIASLGGDGGTIFVAWKEDEELAFAKANMGVMLGAAMTLMPGTQLSGSFDDQISLAVSPSGVFIAAQSFTPARDVMFVASHDGGNSFGTPINLTNANLRIASTRVAASGSNVSVVWVREMLGGAGTNVNNVFVVSSTDAGQTFGAPIDISGTIPIGGSARVAVRQNRVSVLWCRQTSNTNAEGDLYLSTSLDAGVTFGTPALVSDNVSFCGTSQLSINGDKLYAMWLGSGGPSQLDVFVRVSLDGGTTFQPERNVSNSSSRATQSVLAAVGSNVYVAWQQELTTTSGSRSTDIFFAYSTDDGSSYSAPVNLSVGNFDQESWRPAIAASGSYVHILWMDAGVGNFDIFYRRSSDAGQTFAGYRLLPNGPSDPLAEGDPKAVARGADLYAVWIRQQNADPNSELYYYSKRSCPIWPNESGPFRCLICCG